MGVGTLVVARPVPIIIAGHLVVARPIPVKDSGKDQQTRCCLSKAGNWEIMTSSGAFA